MNVDLFAGPGGWDVAAQCLGLDALGVESDAVVCRTREAAGLSTTCADVLKLRPVQRTDNPLVGLIASPPCQTFSKAGKGAGRQALDAVLMSIDLVAQGLPPCDFDDVRTALVVQPLRWALELQPEWCAWEQVPPVLPVWEACADVLGAAGYNVWTGTVNAEEFGVPQTRTRAVLLASYAREVAAPTPTHRRYRHGVPQDEGDPNLLPWVSMAEALGWESLFLPEGAKWTAERPSTTVMRDARVARPGHKDMTGMYGGGAKVISSVDIRARINDQSGSGDDGSWTMRRPATTIAGREIVGAPGTNANRFNGATKSRNDGIRVTVEEAGILQSFPADYPWRGTKTQKFGQVGNAVPPMLAAALLKVVAL